jgi:hypothetical protein
MPSLAEFQRDFASALRARAGMDVAEAPGLTVHRNTTTKALIDAVAANYPTVEVLMGKEWLTGAASDYMQQYPPASAVLAGYGEAFPEFLGNAGLHGWPWLPDVARLDRAWTHAFLSPDVPALTAARLDQLQPALTSLRLALHPSATFGVHSHSAVSLWQANRPPATPPAELSIEDQPEAALLLRNPDGVLLLPLDAAGQAFLQAITAGRDVAAAAADALQIASQDEVARIWSTLLINGAFAGIQDHGD